jgi:hypothetical protein
MPCFGRQCPGCGGRLVDRVDSVQGPGLRVPVEFVVDVDEATSVHHEVRGVEDPPVGETVGVFIGGQLVVGAEPAMARQLSRGMVSSSNRRREHTARRCRSRRIDLFGVDRFRPHRCRPPESPPRGRQRSLPRLWPLRSCCTNADPTLPTPCTANPPAGQIGSPTAALATGGQRRRDRAPSPGRGRPSRQGRRSCPSAHRVSCLTTSMSSRRRPNVLGGDVPATE